jgi:hypothetical protein
LFVSLLYCHTYYTTDANSNTDGQSFYKALTDSRKIRFLGVHNSQTTEEELLFGFSEAATWNVIFINEARSDRRFLAAKGRLDWSFSWLNTEHGHHQG